MDVAILYSLPTRRGKTSRFVVTDTDSELSAKKIYHAIKHRVTAQLVPISEDTIASIKNVHADVLINIIEWDGLDLPLTLKAFDYMESLGIPLAGATKKNYLMTTDKLLMKKALDAKNLPTAPWQAFITGTEPIKQKFRYPLMVKLSATHCSVGLDADAVVADEGELKKRVKQRLAEFRQPVFAEEFIDGREFQVTMLERARGLAMLPPAEIFFDVKGKNRFLTFASRWIEDHPDYNTSSIGPATLDSVLERDLRSVCLRAFRVMHFRDYARFDIRVRAGGGKSEIFFLETNSNPGLDESDDYGMTISYRAAGMTFADFLFEIINSALR